MIVHIVPTLPPDLDGLADYACKLSQNWPDKTTSWGCLTLQIPTGAAQAWPSAVFATFEPSQTGLETALEGLHFDTLILHYVNYAYHLKGAPTWLPVALAHWKQAHPRQKLVVMFHELWATGAPWRSCFWVLPTAKSIVASLSQTSDHWVTSCGNYFDKIVAVGGAAAKGAVIPVATGIEPSIPIDFGRSWPLENGQKLKIAVFGLAPTRNTALAAHADWLAELCTQGLVERISVLGQKPRSEKDSERLESLIVTIGHADLWQRAYDLSPLAVSELLREHDLGIVKETAPLLTKSSVFAALCSHGILPVCAASQSVAPNLAEEPYLVASNPQELISVMKNPALIARHRAKVEALATTSLRWSSVAQNWMNHIQTRA